MTELLALLPAGGLTTTEWCKEAKRECGIAERTFYEMIKTARSSGRAFKSAMDSKWTRKA